MKKKTLLFTTLAGTMLVAGMTVSSVNAASEKTIVRMTSNYPVLNKNSVAVELMDGETELIKEDLIELVESKLVKEDPATKKMVPMNVKVETVIGKDGKEVAAGARVGTGATVKLSTGKEMVVVLYGDVNEDGRISIGDVQAIANHMMNNTLDEVQSAAAEVKLTNTNVLNISDVQRLAEYVLNSEEYKGTDKQYTDIVPEKDTMVETMNLQVTATPATVYPEVSEDGTTVKVKAVLDTETGVTRNGYSGKWAKIDLKAMEKYTDWSIDEENKNVEVVRTADEAKTITNVYVWVELKSENSVTVALTNMKDSTEKMNVTFKVVDVKMPTALQAGLEAPLTDISISKSLTVTMNANTMEVTKRKDKDGNEVEGKWYKLNFVVDMPYDQIEVIELQKDEKDPTKVKKDEYGKYVYTKYDVEEGEATTLTGKYNVVVWLDASKPTTKLVFKNKEAADPQISSDGTISTGETNAVTVTLDNQGDIELVSIDVGNIDDDSDSELYTNGTKINSGTSSITKADDYTINVEGKLNEMKPFVFGKKSDGSIDYTNVIGEGDEGYTEADAKKYYVLVIDTGYNNAKIAGKDIITDKTIIEKFTTKQGTALDTLIMLVLDTDQLEKTYKLTNAFNPDVEGEKQESFTFTVKFLDVSEPKAYSARRLVATDKALADFAVDTSNTTITANIIKSAMTESKHNDVEGLWYQMVIDTKVNNKLLTVKDSNSKEIEQNVEGLSDTEVMVWIDASQSSQEFTIDNVNKTNPQAITVTIQEATGTRKLDKTTNAIIAPTFDDADHKSNVLSAMGTSNEEDLAAAKVNMGAITFPITTPTGTDDINVTYKIKVNYNKLKTFNLNGKSGKWLPLLFNIGDNSNLADKWYDNNAYLVSSNVGYFTGDAESKALLWVNADVLPNLEDSGVTVDNAVPFVFEIRNDKYDVVEKLTARLIVEEDTSTFDSSKSTPNATNAYDAKNDTFIKEHKVFGTGGHFAEMDTSKGAQYLTNQALIDSVKVDKKEGNTVYITVTGDFASMYDLANNNDNTGKLMTLKLDLGVEITANKYELNYTTDAKAETWKHVTRSEAWDSIIGSTLPTEWTVKDYGCSSTETIWNTYINIEPGKSTGIVYTDKLEYRAVDDRNDIKDTLVFVINYVQGPSKADQKDNLYKSYEAKLGEFFKEA